MQIKVNNFKLKETLLSGQCFRVFKNEDSSFTIILKDRIVILKQIEDVIIIDSNNRDDLENVVKEYFDLNRDYKKINKQLQTDNIMKNVIELSSGYRIMNQNPFEMCISYIISQNNNVKRISNSIEKICFKYGKKIIYNEKEYYMFPSYDEIKDADINSLRETGIGFRDKYIKDFLDKYSQLKDINKLSTNDALEELMTIKGIGLKVASCILLFGYKRLDSFPIDTWVKKFISENYEIKNDQKSIEQFTKEKFGKYSGVAIQYMYHSQRNIKNKQ
ncbi:MAG: 8-oxoguanine DNA glycosylase [Tenericutes bacterium]|nr:8-oxoguanine DNA glycosylase [Mycoplasmatota bacterium]